MNAHHSRPAVQPPFLALWWWETEKSMRQISWNLFLKLFNNAKDRSVSEYLDRVLYFWDTFHALLVASLRTLSGLKTFVPLILSLILMILSAPWGVEIWDIHMPSTGHRLLLVYKYRRERGRKLNVNLTALLAAQFIASSPGVSPSLINLLVLWCLSDTIARWVATRWCAKSTLRWYIVACTRKSWKPHVTDYGDFFSADFYVIENVLSFHKFHLQCLTPLIPLCMMGTLVWGNAAHSLAQVAVLGRPSAPPTLPYAASMDGGTENKTRKWSTGRRSCSARRTIICGPIIDPFIIDASEKYSHVPVLFPIFHLSIVNILRDSESIHFLLHHCWFAPLNLIAGIQKRYALQKAPLDKWEAVKYLAFYQTERSLLYYSVKVKSSVNIHVEGTMGSSGRASTHNNSFTLWRDYAALFQHVLFYYLCNSGFSYIHCVHTCERLLKYVFIENRNNFSCVYRDVVKT